MRASFLVSGGTSGENAAFCTPQAASSHSSAGQLQSSSTGSIQQQSQSNAAPLGPNQSWCVWSDRALLSYIHHNGLLLLVACSSQPLALPHVLSRSAFNWVDLGVCFGRLVWLFAVSCQHTGRTHSCGVLEPIAAHQ